MANTYYVYIYLDPRKSGVFEYEGIPESFSYEPFYVGKGKRSRDQHHLNVALGTCKKAQWENRHKYSKLKSILAVGLSPIILRVLENLTEEEAELKEELYIEKIGRVLTGTGPLTNLASGNPFKGSLVLTGKNHPLFGKPRSEVTRQKIKEHHQDVSGSKNSRAKKWKLTSPEGEVFIIEGTLKQFCEEHKLALGILKRNRNKGPYHMLRMKKTKGFASNTENWASEEI